MSRVLKISLLAMLMALAIVVSIAESFIPSFTIPGIKLGLANIIILIVLYQFGFIEALCVNIGRVFISSLLRGTIFQMGFFMSLTGALLSLLMMFIFKTVIKQLHPVGVSVIGSLFHVFGQIVIASIFLGTPSVFYYLPILTLTSIATGILVALVYELIVKTKVFENLKVKYKMK